MKKYENIEGTRIEYKEKVEYKRPKSWLKSISAFSNTFWWKIDIRNKRLR